MQWSLIHPKKSLQECKWLSELLMDQLRRVRENLVRRAEARIDARGAHFENLL